VPFAEDLNVGTANRAVARAYCKTLPKRSARAAHDDEFRQAAQEKSPAAGAGLLISQDNLGF
jgi:hypothetical protein